MPTYTPLQSIELTATTTSFSFSNIPSTYQDLVLVANFGVTAGGSGAALSLRFNGDSGTNYSFTTIYGNGFNGVSQRFSNQTVVNIERSVAPTASAIDSNAIINIQNYSNTSTNKTTISRANSPTGTYPGTEASVNLWRSTAAIYNITVLYLGGESFAAGSTFDLYGISPVAANNAQAFGGTEIYYDSSYVYHVFKGSGTFTPYRNLTADYLVVAGGGSGGSGGTGATNGGGGGGAGGVRSTVTWTGGRAQGSNIESALSLTANTSYTVTIGAGGAGTTSVRTNGSDSVFSSITSTGGGAGGNRAASNFTGSNGGSGGGGGTETGASSNTQSGGTGTTGQGFGGGSGTTNNSNAVAGGGGGGASATGSNASISSNVGTGGNGGAGLWTALSNATSIGQLSGGNYYIAGGGGGLGFAGSGGTATAGSAGLGGGGAGGANISPNAAPIAGNGTTNTGGGGGSSGAGAGSGGSGLVIIRYAR